MDPAQNSKTNPWLIIEKDGQTDHKSNAVVEAGIAYILDASGDAVVPDCGPAPEKRGNRPS